jgi:hypothetical protein
MGFLLNIHPNIVAIPMGIATILGYIFSGNALAFLVFLIHIKYSNKVRSILS